MDPDINNYILPILLFIIIYTDVGSQPKVLDVDLRDLVPVKFFHYDLPIKRKNSAAGRLVFPKITQHH